MCDLSFFDFNMDWLDVHTMLRWIFVRFETKKPNKIRRPLLVRGTRLWNSGLVCCNRSVVCGLFGLTGLWSMVCGLFDLRSVLWSIEAQTGRKSPPTFPGLEIFGDPGNLKFLTLFFTPFFNHFGVPFGPAFCLKIWKQGFQSSMKRVHENGSKKCDLGVL